MHRIRIDLPSPVLGGYDVVIGPGLLERLGPIVDQMASAPRYALVADATVAALYAVRVAASLSVGGAVIDTFTFPPGESCKTRATWTDLTDRMLAARIGRDACVVALGGGVTGDVAGFVAATYMRGLRVVQVPTSLLAMVDASIGGKTGVDTPAGKNLVGAFHQPSLVAIDPRALSTLPDVELRSGLAEAVKHGAIADAEYLDWIAANAAALLRRDEVELDHLVRRSVEIKADHVRRDPFERAARAALNFGHTIGHAIEQASGYALPHGFAVAAGMVVEAELAIDAGIASPDTADALRRVLDLLGLPVVIPIPASPDALLAAAAMDKKARDGRLRFALISRPGAVQRTEDGSWTHRLDPDRVRRVLAGLRVL